MKIRTIALRTAATTGLVLGAVIALGPSAGATTPGAVAPAATPAISVTPSTALPATAAVTVSATGLTAGTTYFIGECAAVSATEFACDPTGNTSAVASASGTLSIPLTVHKVFQGTTGPEGTPWGTVNCAVQACSVTVYDAAFSGGSVPITFV
jgi:hypothetical protein